MAANVSTIRLTRSGFTEAQASAIAGAAEAISNDAVETLRHQLMTWHALLALYLLVEIGVVLLSLLLMQAIHEPLWGARTAAANFRCEALTKIDFW